jgi:uncharacterized protein (TIGR03435 family)
MINRFWIVSIALGALGVPVVRGQDGKISFEVASVKLDRGSFRTPNFALDAGDAYAETGGRFSADFALPTYITFAYKLSLTEEQKEAMLAKLPKWVTEERFDIQAKAADPNVTKDQMRLMMQTLLVERFQLAVHFETGETSVFALQLVQSGTLGPKLRPHSEGPPCDAPPPPGVFPSRCNLMAGTLDGSMVGSRDTTIPLIATALSSYGRLGRPVIDRTGLQGRFDFTMAWSAQANGLAGEPAPGVLGPSFPEALREQLGLKLESTKVLLPVLVIDRVERPTEN